MAASTRLTQETYERLQTELDDLKTRGRIEVAKAIEAARALGDLSENGDYHAAKDTQGKMEARIRQLTQLLREAKVGTAPMAQTGQSRFSRRYGPRCQRLLPGPRQQTAGARCG